MPTGVTSPLTTASAVGREEMPRSDGETRRDPELTLRENCNALGSRRRAVPAMGEAARMWTSLGPEFESRGVDGTTNDPNDQR